MEGRRRRGDNRGELSLLLFDICSLVLARFGIGLGKTRLGIRVITHWRLAWRI